MNALDPNTKTAKEMALTSHNLSHSGQYARTADGALWIWSDVAECWKQIDREALSGASNATAREIVKLCAPKGASLWPNGLGCDTRGKCHCFARGGMVVS